MSPGARRNAILGVAVGGVYALALGLPSQSTLRNFEVMPEMVRAVAAESFDPSTVLPAAMVLQLPPEGAIARGYLPLGYGPGQEEAIRAGAELRNPLSSGSDADVVRGGAVFRTFCRVCHGPEGAGDGPVAKRGFPAPPPLTAESARNLPDGRIFHVISLGQGNMPGYQAQTERADRWRAVLWIRKLQAKAAAEQGGAAAGDRGTDSSFWGDALADPSPSAAEPSATAVEPPAESDGEANPV